MLLSIEIDIDVRMKLVFPVKAQNKRGSWTGGMGSGP